MADEFVQVVYVGPFTEGVIVPDTGLDARPGEPVDVTPELAKRLLEQPANWQPVESTKPARPAKED